MVAPAHAAISNLTARDSPHADNKLLLDPPLDTRLLTVLSTPKGHGTLRLLADDVCEAPCVAPVFASGVAGFVACGCAATATDVETAILVLWD